MIHSAPAGVKAAARPAPKIGVPFAPIPLDVKARRDLSPAAKLVFATLANQARMRRGDVSNLTNNQIAARDGLNVASVRRALDQLEALGLIRRLWGASHRIRLGVAIVYAPVEGVAQGEQPRNPRVAHPAQPGCALEPKGGCAPGATDLLRRGEEPLKTASTISTGGEEDDPSARVAEGPEAAAYLRACIAAGRRGETPPPLPCPAPPAPVEVPKPPTVQAAGKAPSVPQDDASREVGRLVRDLSQALRSETVGPRRVGPARLARQLAEVSRRHGAQASRPSDASTSRRQESGTSRHQDVATSRRSGVGTSGSPGVEASGSPGTSTSRRPDVETPGNPDAATPRRCDV